MRYDNTDVTLDELINSVRDSSDADADSAASAENDDLETLREEAEEMIERLTEEEAEEPSGDIGDTPDESAHGERAEAASVTDKDGEDSAQTAEIADEKAFSNSDSPPAAEKSDPEDTDDVPSEDVQAKEVPTEEMQKNIPDGMPENEESPEDALHEETDDTAAGENNKSKKTPVAKIIASLTVICAVIAAMLAAVNAFTADRIAKNTELEKENSIRKIFGSYITAEEYTDFESPEEMYVYLVYKSNMLYGSFGLRRTDKHDGRNRRRLRHCGREYSFNVRNSGSRKQDEYKRFSFRLRREEGQDHARR